MFNEDFYPTPTPVIERMLQGFSLNGKTILEPSAGKGNIVDFCIGSGATLLACEKNLDLQKIVASKCKIIASDFLDVSSSDISHIDMIVMNPPFTADEKHISHAWKIAPAGCDIIALCNTNTFKNAFSTYRKELREIVEQNGNYTELGDVFATAERKTGVNVSLVIIKKPANDYETEFAGFFTEEDADEAQENGIMPYNLIRDVVNRYIGAVKTFDEQLEAAVKMQQLTGSFFKSKIGMTCTIENKPAQRNEFKTDLQKSAWNFIFQKMQMDKYTTKGLKEDINKFVENQSNIPFSMSNIYKMIEVIVGTNGVRMDRALLEVFDKLTAHYHDNRYYVEGWKTNSHWLVNEKFILPYLASFEYGSMRCTYYGGGGNVELIEDLIKALCWLTGERYEDHTSLSKFLNNTPVDGSEPSYRTEYKKYQNNVWYDWGFFEIKGFKKGTIHFKFKDKKVWELFNRRVAKIKGYPLPEHI